MARSWWKYWRFVVFVWNWFFKISMFFRSKEDEAVERKSSIERIERTLTPAASQVSRSSSMSGSSTSVPNFCVTECDDEAEPYWHMMVNTHGVNPRVFFVLFFQSKVRPRSWNFNIVCLLPYQNIRV